MTHDIMKAEKWLRNTDL